MFLSSSRLTFIIFCCFIVKILLAMYLPLVNDEAYAIAVSKEFSLSFFDHPPIGFWSSLFFTKLLGLQNDFLFRLPFLFFGLGTTLILFELGKEAGGHTAGLWSALIYNLSPFFLLSGGILVVPDGPLNLGIAGAALCVIKLHKKSNEGHNFLLIILGILLAWSLASKYQAYLFGLGCLLVLLTSPKRQAFLRNPYFYLCLAIAFLGAIPTIVWNSQHQWISFQFHGARQGVSIQLNNATQMFFGMMIYLLPSIILIPLVNLRYSIKKTNKNTRTSGLSDRFLVLMALPNIIFFSFVFFSSKNTLPHWIIPGWLLLIPMVAKVLSHSQHHLQRTFFFGSALFIWPILGLLILHTQNGFLTNRLEQIPAWDNTLEIIDWSPVKKPLQSLIDKEMGHSTKPKLAALTWMEAGQISAIMNNQYETLVLEDDPHHFSFLRRSNTISPTFLVKVSLGLKPDIINTLKRIRKHEKNAIHVRDVILFRGSRDYATASIYMLKQ